mmetsp:Transcript_41206/g.124409  ORF Transcript_41206/g.124409 Transcript_41206/m.124409 type:complete len:317 (+) Transcript_41206:916-1866(+)
MGENHHRELEEKYRVENDLQYQPNSRLLRLCRGRCSVKEYVANVQNDRASDKHVETQRIRHATNAHPGLDKTIADIHCGGTQRDILGDIDAFGARCFRGSPRRGVPSPLLRWHQLVRQAKLGQDELEVGQFCSLLRESEGNGIQQQLSHHDALGKRPVLDLVPIARTHEGQEGMVSGSQLVQVDGCARMGTAHHHLLHVLRIALQRHVQQRQFRRELARRHAFPIKLLGLVETNASHLWVLAVGGDVQRKDPLPQVPAPGSAASPWKGTEGASEAIAGRSARVVAEYTEGRERLLSVHVPSLTTTIRGRVEHLGDC